MGIDGDLPSPALIQRPEALSASWTGVPAHSGASVSTQHANFIVTEPGATADDVMQLLDLIKQRVFDNAGLELETEVVVWKREEEED